jgi:transcriptional regulator with XRE-family HTH domain
MNKLTKLDLEFGKILRKKRLYKNLTQEVLSVESGLSRAYISELEMGHKDPSLFTLFKLSSALNIKISSLIDEINIEAR